MSALFLTQASGLGVGSEHVGSTLSEAQLSMCFYVCHGVWGGEQQEVMRWEIESFALRFGVEVAG